MDADVREHFEETWRHFDGIAGELRQEMHVFRDELQQEISGVRDEPDQKISGVRDELRQEIAAVRDENRLHAEEYRRHTDEVSEKLHQHFDVCVEAFKSQVQQLAEAQIIATNRFTRELSEIREDLREIRSTNAELVAWIRIAFTSHDQQARQPS